MGKSIYCPACQKRYPFDDRLYDKTLQCKCGKKFQVPRPAEAASQPAELGGGSPSIWDDEVGNELAAAESSSGSTTLPPLPKQRAAERQPSYSSSGPSFALESNGLLSWGITLIVLGVGSFLLPHIGLQFKLLMLLGIDTPIIGSVLALIGAALVFASQLDGSPLVGGMLAVGALVLLGGMWLIPPAEEAAPDNPPQLAARPMQPMAPRPQASPIEPRGSGPRLTPPNIFPETVPTPNFGPRSENESRPGIGPRQRPSRRDSMFPRPRGFATPEDTPPGARPPSKRPIESRPHTEFVGGDGGGGYRSYTSGNYPAIGFRYSLSKSIDGEFFNEFNPLFSHNIPAVPGKTDVFAKEGYVVGGLNVAADESVRAIQIIYMRINGSRLDVSDSYESEWIGTPGQLPVQKISGDGRFPIGVIGNKGQFVNSISLILIE